MLELVEINNNLTNLSYLNSSIIFFSPNYNSKIKKINYKIGYFFNILIQYNE